MAWSDAADMFVDVCEDIGAERAAIITQLTQKLAVEAELDVLASGDPGKAAIQNAIEADRAAYRAIASRWRQKMDTVLAYMGTQIATPSKYVKAGRPTNRILLLRDIRAGMVTGDYDVDRRKVTWAAEPTADDAGGIINRLVVDESNVEIEGGLPATIDCTVIAKPAQYRSITRLQARTKGIDIFNLLGPDGFVDIEAVNGAGGRNLVTNPNLSNANSSTDETAVTSLSGWTVSDAVAGMTHKIDTDIAYRGNAFSHKLYGTSGTRRFSQPLIVARSDIYTPRLYMLAVYVTGTVAGTLTVTWGSKSQAFTIGSLSAGWNYLILDRDRDLFPSQFDSGDNVLQIDVAMTTGDASNYINLAYVGGQNMVNFNGAYYAVWSRNGVSTLYDLNSLADSQDGAGLNQNALYYAYHGTEAANYAYLRHIDDGTETIADYT